MLLLTLPLAWGGFSQTFGLRGSTWLWRTWTCGLFNLALVWFAYPVLTGGSWRAVGRPDKDECFTPTLRGFLVQPPIQGLRSATVVVGASRNKRARSVESNWGVRWF